VLILTEMELLAALSETIHDLLEPHKSVVTRFPAIHRRATDAKEQSADI